MNGVTPTGLSNGAGRSDAAKFFSQSENDVAAAFAELLKYEGVSPSDEPSSTPPPPASGTQHPASESSTSGSSDSKASSAPVPTPAPNSASTQQAEDESKRDDDEEAVVASAAVPAPTQQQTRTDATPAEGAGSTEEAELEAILADARSVQQELDASGAKQAKPDQTNVAAPGDEGAATFPEELIAAAQAADTAANGAAVDPAADASPRVNVPGDTEILDPLRRTGVIDEESDTEEGSAVEDLVDDGGVDEETLATLVAKASAMAESAQDGKTDGRDAKPKSDRREKADAAAGVEAASQAAGAERAADASAAVVASTASVETTTSTTKTDGAAVEAPGANVSAGSSARHETTGSLQRSIERPTEADRRHLAGADRSRFFDRVERAFKSAEQGDGSIRMRLHPAELGSMQLTLEQGESGEWIARIETETQEAKQTLLEHAGALKERLADQDFHLARIEVETPADRRQQNAPDFQENPQSFSRGRDRRDDETRGEDRPAEAAPASAAPGDRSRRLDVTI
jgi:flagellar hook-length control protein FliK